MQFDRLREDREALRGPIQHCAANALEKGCRQWFGVRYSMLATDLQDDFFEADTADAFLWQEPNRGTSILGLGRLATLDASGPSRFGEASVLVRQLFGDLHLVDLESNAAAHHGESVADERGPLLHGGFAFYDAEVDLESEWHALGAGRLILPEVGVVVRDQKAWVTRVCAVHPGDDVDVVLDRIDRPIATRSPQPSNFANVSPVEPSLDLADAMGEQGPEIRVQADRAHGRYLAQVQGGLEAIEAGKVEKVVLARSLRVSADCDFDLASFLSSLRDIYPSCVTVAVRDGDSYFISATPERLVALQGDRVTTAAIAGSAPRGRSREEEERYSTHLLESEKERVEHQVVQRFIRDALAGVCGELQGPASPSLLKLEGIQHLETPLRGHLNPGSDVGVLDLVGALHPTPAVGGAPSAVAVEWLSQHEALDRGWYAGPIGYVDGNGNGEFRVALRSALLQGCRARLFAGAGIVPGSEPDRELAETRLKLRALLAPLTEI